MDELDHPVGVARQEEPSRHRPLTWATVIVAALVLFAWVSFWSQRTPGVLDVDGTTTAGFPPGPDRGPFQVGVVLPSTSGAAAEISLVELRPVVVRNTADAIISFHVCAPREGADPIGALAEPLEKHCARVRAAEQTSLLPAGEYVVMTIAPDHAGVVRVSGVEVTYRQGWQMAWLPRTVHVAAGARVKVT